MAPPDLKITHLRAFAAVAAAGSYAGAARSLAVAPPLLSRRVKALEAQLAVRLLERSRAPVTLTAAGRELLPRARAILERHDRLLARLAPPPHQNGRTHPFSP